VAGGAAAVYEPHAQKALDGKTRAVEQQIVAPKQRKVTGTSPNTKAGRKARAGVKSAKAEAKTVVAASKEAKVVRALKVASGPLDALGSGATAVDQYQKSTATTTTGKVVDAGLAGAADLAFGKANPIVAGVDAVVGAVLPDGANISIGNTMQTSVRAIVTVGDGLVTGNERGMATFHDRSKEGQYGPVFRASSEAGDFWADKGVVGGLKEFGGAVADGWRSLW
jgi:hypothetical protein